VVIVCAGFGAFAQTRSDLLIADRDTTVSPGADFFAYANGRWFKEHPIPPTEASNGLWQVIQDTINAQIRSVCETSAADPHEVKGSPRQKIGDFFASGMDSVSLNSRGINDLRDELAMVREIRDPRGIARVASYLHAVAGSPLFSFAVAQDDRNSAKYAIAIWQGGLSLPDRRYYLDPDSSAVAIRAKFVTHVQRMLALAGEDAALAAGGAQRIMYLETALAKAARKREDTRDPLLNYNKMSYRSLESLTPRFDWHAFFESAGLRNVDSVIVGQPEYLTALDSCLSSIPLQDWKQYLTYQLLRGLAQYVDDKTYAEAFSFYGTALTGTPQPKPRWKRVVERTDGWLGELVGQVYVAEYLPKGTKEKLIEIGEAIRKAYADRIAHLEWMSQVTRERALKKLSTVIMKVGYPDRWKDMSSVWIDRSSYVRNVMAARHWRFQYMVAKFGAPVDRTEWEMTPQTYNAYYNASNNEIVVPGCNVILPGYEHMLADDGLLYAVVGGSTFGHELTHGFDDQGCKYDDRGNLNNWWTAEDSIRFFAKTRMIVKQFDDYVAVDTLHINGELTQGENIADLGGIMMGLDAFKTTPQYTRGQTLAGLTPVQRYFLAYALAWMVNQRPEAMANQVRSNEHAPPKFRVLGPLSNMPEFYEAFGVRPGDAMWRPADQRVKIW
jgi:putative endopeptidase